MPKFRDDLSELFDYGVRRATRMIYLGSASIDDGSESGVDSEMVAKFLKAMHILESDSLEPIKIEMNNPGGEDEHGMAIYDRIRASKCHVTITVYGNAQSMGAIILQAADERLLAPHAVVMFHEGEMGFGSTHPQNIKNWMKFYEKYGNRLDKILFDRILEKHPEYKEKKFKEMNIFDSILAADEAVALGLADKVLAS